MSAPEWEASLICEAPERVYVPTGVVNSAHLEHESGETMSLVMSCFSRPFYEDDVRYTRSDLRLPPEIVERVRSQIDADCPQPCEVCDLARDILAAIGEEG